MRVRTYPKRGAVLVKAEAFLEADDWSDLARPGAEPYVRLKLWLLRLSKIQRRTASSRWAAVEVCEAKVYLEDPGRLVPPPLEADGRSPLLVYNRSDLHSLVGRAAKKLFAGAL
jgi:hypothetical protein